jgi:hypothetical protein
MLSRWRVGAERSPPAAGFFVPNPKQHDLSNCKRRTGDLSAFSLQVVWHGRSVGRTWAEALRACIVRTPECSIHYMSVFGQCPELFRLI